MKGREERERVRERATCTGVCVCLYGTWHSGPLPLLQVRLSNERGENEEEEGRMRKGRGGKVSVCELGMLI